MGSRVLDWLRILPVVRINVSMIAIVFGVCFAPYASGEVYRCTNADGKIEFRDRPCEGKATAEKLDVKPNSVAPTDTTEINKKLDVVNKRLAEKAKADDAYRASLSAARAQHDADCRRIAEEIFRQQAWLG